MVKVAVVILNWNGERLLKKFLSSVVKFTPAANCLIVVADNGSTDNSISYATEHFRTIRIVELSQNYGFAEGYNRALKEIDAEYYLLLNSDVEVTNDWLQPMVKYLDKNPEIAAAQPKILSFSDKGKFEYAGAAGGYIDKLGTPFCRGRVLESVESDMGQYNSVEDVFWASGACMLVRSRDFFDVGGFDSSFFAHMEEIDLCWRLRARNRRIVCFPQSVVYHLGGATLDEGSARKVYLNVRNNLFMLFKNLPDTELDKIIKKRILFNRIAAVKFYLTGKKEKCKAIFQAHKDFEALQGNYVAARQENMEKIVLTDIPEIYDGNIITDYYFRTKKLFTDFFS